MCQAFTESESFSAITGQPLKEAAVLYFSVTHAVLTHLRCVCLSGDEIGMLEDMEVGVADLKRVAFTITEAKTEQPDDLLPTLSGTWWEYTHTDTHLYTQ